MVHHGIGHVNSFLLEVSLQAFVLIRVGTRDGDCNPEIELVCIIHAEKRVIVHRGLLLSGKTRQDSLLNQRVIVEQEVLGIVRVVTV